MVHFSATGPSGILEFNVLVIILRFLITADGLSPTATGMLLKDYIAQQRLGAQPKAKANTTTRKASMRRVE